MSRLITYVENENGFYLFVPASGRHTFFLINAYPKDGGFSYHLMDEVAVAVIKKAAECLKKDSERFLVKNDKMIDTISKY